MFNYCPNPLSSSLRWLMFHKLLRWARSTLKKKRSKTQTKSPSPLVLHASGPSNLPINNHPSPLNPADVTPTIVLPLEDQPVPNILIHESPSISQIRNTVQDSNQFALPQLDPGKGSSSIPDGSPVAQKTSNAPQGVNGSPSPRSICAALDNPTRLASPPRLLQLYRV